MRLTSRPRPPTTIIGVEETSGSLPMRLIASITTYTETPNMIRTVRPDANTSARYEPNVRLPVVSLRVAIFVAASAAPSATTSAAM